MGIVYFGADHRVADLVSRRFPVTCLVSERRSFCRDMNNLAALLGAPYCLIDALDDWRRTGQRGQLGISFGFGLIFGGEDMRCFEEGIWNIHLGKLPEMRGRHPLGWTLIQGLRTATASLHRIDARIDRGWLLAEREFPVYSSDSESELLDRFVQSACADLLDAAIAAQASGGGREIGVGQYLPSLAGRWDRVDPAEHDALFVYNLVRAKRRYGGIEVAGHRYARCDLVNPRMRSSYAGALIVRCRDGNEVALS